VPAAEAVGADPVGDVAATAAGVVFEEDLAEPGAVGTALAVAGVADRGELGVDRVGERAAVDAQHNGGAEGERGEQGQEEEGGRRRDRDDRLLAPLHDPGILALGFSNVQ
jgi:hypothetical protein